MAHFEIENLSFAYPGKENKALDGVSLAIEKGEYIVLCGKCACYCNSALHSA